MKQQLWDGLLWSNLLDHFEDFTVRIDSIIEPCPASAAPGHAQTGNESSQEILTSLQNWHLTSPFQRRQQQQQQIIIQPTKCNETEILELSVHRKPAHKYLTMIFLVIFAQCNTSFITLPYFVGDWDLNRIKQTVVFLLFWPVLGVAQWLALSPHTARTWVHILHVLLVPSWGFPQVLRTLLTIQKHA